MPHDFGGNFQTRRRAEHSKFGVRLKERAKCVAIEAPARDKHEPDNGSVRKICSVHGVHVDAARIAKPSRNRHADV
ncbi:MAG: hypothetical protein AB7G28_01000 [Pirellulales bacterium]